MCYGSFNWMFRYLSEHAATAGTGMEGSSVMLIGRNSQAGCSATTPHEVSHGTVKHFRRMTGKRIIDGAGHCLSLPQITSKN